MFTHRCLQHSSVLTCQKESQNLRSTGLVTKGLRNNDSASRISLSFVMFGCAACELSPGRSLACVVARDDLEPEASTSS